MFQALFFLFTVNHNFEETHRAWRQRALETLPPTQHCQVGHTLVESVKEESREVRAKRGQRVQRSLERVEGKNEVMRRGTYPSLPSMAAAPPGMILVMKIPGSSGMWGLSIPPAMLKPRPEFPCTQFMIGIFSRVQ